jgi:hypothetical protein
MVCFNAELWLCRQRPYNHFVANLTELSASASSVLIPSAFIYTGGSSFAVYNAVSWLKNNVLQVDC